MISLGSSSVRVVGCIIAFEIERALRECIDAGGAEMEESWGFLSLGEIERISRVAAKSLVDSRSVAVCVLGGGVLGNG